MTQPTPLAWRSLQRPAQIYVGCVITAGTVLMLAFFPVRYPQPILFVVLLTISCLTSAWKVNPPLSSKDGSTLSVSYAANLTALLLLGPRHAMIVGAAGALTQCAAYVKHRYPLYRTIFSTAAMVITMQATAAVYGGLGGVAGPFTMADLPRPLVAGIAAYFCVNTALVTGAIALSTKQPLWKVWHDDCLWGATSVMVAGTAGAIAAVLLARGQWWHALLMTAPVYLTYRTYEVFLGRLGDQRQHAAQAWRLHDETLEALLQARRAQQALLQEKEHLAVTLRSIGDGVITTDLDGIVLLMNDVAERLTGWSQHEATGQPLTAVFQTFDPETRAPRDSSVRTLMGTGRPGSGRCTLLVARDLSEQPIEEIAAPLRDSSGRMIGMVLAFRDISDALRVQAEHAKASKLESLGLLAGGIARDFNDILTAIMGSVAMARVSDRQTAPREAALTEAEHACVRARQLTWRLLSFASGGVPVREAIAIASPLNEAIRLALRGVIGSYRVDVDTADGLCAIQADERQVVQAFTNVLVNAIEAMPQAGAIEIRGENTFEPVERWENALHVRTGHYVRVSIADTGIGISKEHLCRVWDPYFSTKPGGSGLGLATTYAILKDHGGHVSVESPPGGGTIVRLNFPALPIRSRSGHTPVVVAGDKRRVLIMNDEASDRVLAINMLQLLGYDTAAADDGSGALDLFKSALRAGAPFDVVMLDLKVPGKLGGKEAMAQFVAADPAVKAILVSGYTRDPAMTEFWTYGFSAVLTKPFRLRELAVTMDFVIGAPACRVH